MMFYLNKVRWKLSVCFISPSQNNSRGCRVGSVVKKNCYSHKGQDFDSLYPHRDLHPSVTPVLGDLTPFTDLHKYQKPLWYTLKHAEKIFK